MFEAASSRFTAKAQALRTAIESNLGRVVQCWLLLAGIASAARIAMSPVRGPLPTPEVVAPYLLLLFAPVASLLLALRWFAQADAQPQPRIRLARIGRWTQVDHAAARAHPLYGCDGIMVSLLVALLANIPLRAASYIASMPALAGDVPEWLAVLRAMMTLDVVLMSSLYAIAFVAAIRRLPSFPRLLAAIWALDLTLQLATARLVAAEPGLPLAVADALHQLVRANVAKVLVSVALWLPYLLLSKRVNITFRHRLPA